METVKKLNYLLDKKTKGRLIVVFFLTILGSFAELIGITIVLPIIELAMDSGDINANVFTRIIVAITGATTKETVLLWLISMTILVYIAKNAYLVFMNYSLYKFAADVKRGQATKLMKSYLKQPYVFFLNSNSADLMRGVNNDTAQLYEVVINFMLCISNGLTALEIIVYLAISNFYMTITIAGALAVCGVIIVLGLQKRFRKNGRSNQKYSGFLLRHLQQAFEGIKEIKLLNNEEYFINQYNSTYKKSTDVLIKNSCLNLIPKYLIEIVCIGGILGYLAYTIITKPNYSELMPQLAVFCVAAYKLLPSVNSLSGYTGTIMFHRASIDLVYNDIKAADNLSQTFEKNISNTKPFDFEKKIKLENVTFKYDKADKPVISDSALEVFKGQSVAFIGASGGGKTTTADIILSLLTPDKGKVTVDGVDVQENIWGWRKKLGYIPQSIYLTDDTIRNNVAFGIDKKDIDDNEVWRALDEAQLKEFVESLPDKLDTYVGERGSRISGGQRQRIGIARALYRNPSVLIFDEATSALDNETEKEVMNAVNSLQGTKTIIMIAHRLSTIEKCDVIYRIENGEIVKVSKEEVFGQ